jgi:hypothetical protein
MPAVSDEQIPFLHLPLCELFGQRAIRHRGFGKEDYSGRLLIQSMNDRERRPTRFAMPQPIV